MDNIAYAETLGGDNSDHPIMIPARPGERLSIFWLHRDSYEVAPLHDELLAA